MSRINVANFRHPDATADSITVTSDGDTQINRALGLGGATYGTSGQVLTSAGSGAVPTWQTAATPTVIEASGYSTSAGGSASSDTVIESFSSLDFSNYEGNLLQVFGRTALNENGNVSNTAVLYVTISNGTNTTVIAGSINGIPYGTWSGNYLLDISTSGLYTIPSTYATTGITLRLRASTDYGSFYYGDQPNYGNYDNIGDGINGGIGFQYIVFG